MTSVDNNYRDSSRLPLDLSVTLFYRNGLSSEGTLVDISFGGAFVEVSNATLEPDDLVTLDLYIDDENSSNTCTLSAVVRRKGSNGVGLVFDDYDPATVRSLRRVYHRAMA